MKTIKSIKIVKTLLVLVSLILASFTLYQMNQQIQDEQNILGTWVEKEDGNLKIEYKNTGRCFFYYTGESTREFTYSIETTSPQCNQVVPMGDKFSYLKMINVNDPNEKYCYEIFTLSNEHLQIRLLGRSKSMFFTKQ